MGETIAILFVFFVLILFGLVFYYQWQKSSFERQKVEVFSEESITKSLLASYLPELVCSKASGVITKDCVDLTKLEAAKEEMENDYYFGLFGFATIRVEEIYPGGDDWVLYNRTLETATRQIQTAWPVAIFDPIKNENKFGVLYVQMYT